MNPELSQTTHSKSHHAFLNESLIIIGVILIILCGILLYQNQQLKKELNTLKSPPANQITSLSSPSPLTETSDPILNWKTYTNSKYNFSVRYPPDFLLSNIKEKVEIYSPPHKCEAWPTGELQKIDASEIRLDFSVHNGSNFSQIWKSVFGFEFTQKNYDGMEVIGDKNAYYFFQGAEMVFGRTAYLIELSPTIALEINTWTPSAISNCDKPLNEYPGLTDQILETFKFIVTTESPTPTPPGLNLTIPISWNTYNKEFQKMVFQFSYPEDYQIFDGDQDSGNIELRKSLESGMPAVEIGRLSYYSWPEYDGGSRRDWFVRAISENSSQKGFQLSDFNFKETNFTNGNSYYLVLPATPAGTKALSGFFRGDANFYFGIFNNKAIMLRDSKQLVKDDVNRILQTLKIQ